MWRGHYEVSLCGKSVKLPLHSITVTTITCHCHVACNVSSLTYLSIPLPQAYIWGIALSWNCDLFPSFLFFSVAWAMLACLEHVNRHPSQWQHSPSYFEFLRRLILNSAGAKEVEPGKDAKLIQEYDERQAKAQEQLKEKRRRERAQQVEIEEEVNAKMEAAKEAEKSGFDNTGGFLGLHSPLKPILFPYQLMLREYVRKTRLAKNIVLWYESYYAFWLVTFAFLVSALAFFIPWGFLLTWTLRISVVVLLGPWMKLVDILCFHVDTNKTLKEQEEAFKRKMKARFEKALKSTSFFQTRQERAVKLQDMREFMFGSHLIRVPVLHENFFFDVPLPDSSATPYRGKEGPIEVAEVKYGQTLEGDMIPKRELQMAEENARKRFIGEQLVSKGKNIGRVARDAAMEVPTKLLAGVFQGGKKITFGAMDSPLLRNNEDSSSDGDGN